MECVDIVGDGLAACCCAHLLSSFSLRIKPSTRSRPARLLLSEQTQSLLRDTFAAPDLFQHARQIRRRVVLWGDGAAPVELPHRGVVVHEQELLSGLWQRVAALKPSTDPAWKVISVANGDFPSRFRGFGSRVATVALVTLAAQAGDDCCWVESLPDGWLFLLPSEPGRGALISCGYSPGDLLEKSRLIGRMVSSLDGATGAAHHHPAFPQIAEELCGPHWLACGSAAMMFDPLCGEGAGHAVREALLASAVIRASGKGSPMEALLAHYADRFMQGFLKHLEVCLPFYRSGGSSDFWKTEAAELEAGIAWMQGRLSGQTPARFRLAGYELQPIGG